MNAERNILSFADLVGKPYELNAAGPDAWDCVTLMMEVTRRLGIAFPPPPGYGQGEITGTHLMTWKMQLEAAEPESVGAVAYVVSPDGHDHTAVAIGRGKLIHCRSGIGVTIEPIRAYRGWIRGWYKPKGSR